jgi:MFS family permease
MREANEQAATKRRRLRAPKTFNSLKHPDFRLLWITSVINAAGNWVQQVTLGWLAYDVSDNALLAALTFGIRSLPQLLIGPIGGVFGDRFDRKRGVMINSSYLAILSFGFALLLIFGTVQAWHILLFSFMQGLGQALVGPTRQALVANTVPREDLMNAIALNSLAQTSMRLIGPAVAGGLIAFFGPALNFGIQSAGAMIVVLLMIPMKTPYTEVGRRRVHASLTESFTQGISYVWRQPTLLGLMALALVPTLFTTPINLGLLPVFARDQLNVDSGGLGLLYSAQGFGAVIGTMALATFSSFSRKGLIISGAVLVLTITITLYSQVTYFFLAVPMLALATCCYMTYNTVNQTIIQTITPDEYRGRVMGLQMMDHGLTPLGTLILGAIAEVWGVSTAILLSGLCAMTFVSFVLIRFPAIREFRTGIHAEALPVETEPAPRPAAGPIAPAAGVRADPG